MWFSFHAALPECKMSSLAGKSAPWLLPDAIYKPAELNWMRTEQRRGSCNTDLFLPFERHQLCDSCAEQALQKRGIFKKARGQALISFIKLSENISKTCPGYLTFNSFAFIFSYCIPPPSPHLPDSPKPSPFPLVGRRTTCRRCRTLGHSQLALRDVALGFWPRPLGDCTFHTRDACAAATEKCEAEVLHALPRLTLQKHTA